MFYKLHYFKKGKELCGNDFLEKDKVDTINLSLVSSISDLQQFRLPFSGTFKGNYGLLSMNNGDIYYLKEESFSDLSDTISRF